MSAHATDETFWYDETGSGRPLVFVHGGWLNGDAWRAQVDSFAPEYRVVTLDVRGHGRSGATDTRRYSVDLFTDDLENLLDHLDVERPYLCGLSLGSMIVQAYLDRHPGRARGAILAGAMQSMPPVTMPRGTKALCSPLPALTTALSVAGPRATFQSLLGGIRAQTGGYWLSVDPDVRSWAMDAVGDVSNAEFRKIFGALYDFEPPSLSGVETPTLVVHGESEAPGVRRQGERIAAAVDEGRSATVPDAGHLVNQDNPAAFDALVGEFLDETDAP